MSRIDISEFSARTGLIVEDSGSKPGVLDPGDRIRQQSGVPVSYEDALVAYGRATAPREPQRPSLSAEDASLIFASFMNENRERFGGARANASPSLETRDAFHFVVRGRGVHPYFEFKVSKAQERVVAVRQLNILFKQPLTGWRSL